MAAPMAVWTCCPNLHPENCRCSLQEAASKTPTGSHVTERAGSPIHAISPYRQESLATGGQRVKGAGGPDKPVSQSLYIDLTEDPDTPPQPIHLGFRSGANHLRAYLVSLQEIGVNHVAINLRFNQADIETTMKRLADDILPDFT